MTELEIAPTRRLRGLGDRQRKGSAGEVQLLGAASSTDRPRGRLIVLVGPSAVSKSTVVRRVRELLPDLFFSVSATTRDPRPGEVDGRDYRFVTRDEFDRMIAEDQLLE